MKNLQIRLRTSILIIAYLLTTTIYASAGTNIQTQGSQPKYSIADHYTWLIKSNNRDKQALSQAYSNRGEYYRRNKIHAKAISDLNMALSLDPQNTAAYNNRANYFADVKDYKTAISDLNKAIEIDDRNLISYINRGAIYSEMKNYEMAIEDYGKAIQINRRCVPCYFNRGTTYLKTGQLDKAISDFSKTTNINPNNYMAYYNRALAYIKLDEYALALQDYEHSLAIHDTDSTTLNGFAWFLATCPEPKYKNGMRSIELAQRAIYLSSGQDLNKLDTLATAYAESGFLQKAINTLKEAIQIAQKDNNAKTVQEMKTKLEQYTKKLETSK
ncbi:hypothetical protein SYK_28010 [Pseudodesulfovibrio nedwellii]|uniref:Tetratricopeptide repeat protein n=1 Tax=Pseudodesulfovibrio nedwellii TaxID=2973072 RepID=A0ABM8B451_9BACT|nr:tetratricopeptide repeat protein [Pseudodesulfovibrio nedwellii]BDQ38441.1 hypothetical protein SYK_28010 [Pseudodesulfovibrio nedwellii]